ncbi:MAG: hypothetical protein ACI9WU_004363, partial [Myxococcota bacterium]
MVSGLPNPGRLTRLISFALIVATPLACTGKVEVTRVARKAPAKPGATGRAVLWITPKPDHPLG